MIIDHTSSYDRDATEEDGTSTASRVHYVNEVCMVCI